MQTKPITAVIVGCGHRSVTYADYSLSHPDRLKIVGVADPNRERCLMAAHRYGFSEENCFSSANELAQRGKIADVVFNGTMDHQHYETSMPLLKAGYDMLLEKPFAVSKQEMDELIQAVHTYHNRVMICHVLRYAPFYSSIRQRILNGEIGEIINIQTTEHVSYHHLVTSYVRGKWANSEVCKTGMLLAKSCHDIDMMMWMMSPTLPKTVCSTGSLMQFKPENAPKGAGTRCTVDCPYVDTCNYSSKRLYLDNPDQWVCYVWAEFENKATVTLSDRLKSFANGNPYNRCVYRCDNNVVDHQSVLIQFENGATGTHNMIGGAAVSKRTIHVIGTKGEVNGCFEDNIYQVRTVNPQKGSFYETQTVDLSAVGTQGHGGGDEALTEDFINFVQNGGESVSCTSIDNSIAGHLTVFLAEKSMEEGSKVQVCDFSEYFR